MKTLDRCFSIDACISAVRSCSHDSMEWPLGATPSASCAKHEVKRGRICVEGRVRVRVRVRDRDRDRVGVMDSVRVTCVSKASLTLP